MALLGEFRFGEFAEIRDLHVDFCQEDDQGRRATAAELVLRTTPEREPNYEMRLRCRGVHQELALGGHLASQNEIFGFAIADKARDQWESDHRWMLWDYENDEIQLLSAEVEVVDVHAVADGL